MGQKVNPIGLRLGINRNWESRWFPTKQSLPENIGEDYKIRAFLKKKLYYAGISQILIERTAKKTSCNRSCSSSWYHHRQKRPRC